MEVNAYGKADDHNNALELKSHQNKVLDRFLKETNNFQWFGEEATFENSALLIMQRYVSAQLVYDFLNHSESSPRFYLEQFQSVFIKVLDTLATNENKEESIFKFWPSKFENVLKLAHSASTFEKRNGNTYWFELSASSVPETSIISVYADGSSSSSSIVET